MPRPCGATTLRVYSAWMSEADQKAAGTFTVRMPTPPLALLDGDALAPNIEPHDPASPYRQIAADLAGAIACGVLRPGDPLPTAEQLKHRYSVSAGTANRAVAELKSAGLVTASRGRRAIVRAMTATAEVIPLPKAAKRAPS